MKQKFSLFNSALCILHSALRLPLTLLAVLMIGVGNVWGATYVLNFEGSGAFPNNEKWTCEGDESTAVNHTTNGTKCASFGVTATKYITFVDALTNVESISFWHNRTSKNTTNPTLTLQGSTNNGSTWTDLGSVTPTIAKNTWNQSTITLTKAFTGKIRLAYSCSSTAVKYIDDITITTKASCSYTLDTPSPFVPSDITISGATLSWTGDDNASSYTVTIDDTEIENATSPYQVTGLAENTTYTWSVKAIGDGTTYCDSEEADGTSFKTLEDLNKKVVDFSFTSNISGWPTSSYAGDYTYTKDKVDYTFSLTANVYCSSTYLMVKSGAALGLPAIKNYKLTKVVISNSSGCSTSTSVSIRNGSQSTSTVVIGGTAQTFETKSSSYTYNLSGTAANTMYYVYVASNNCQVTNLELTYSYVEPTKYAVYFSKPSNGTLVINDGTKNITSGTTIAETEVLTVTATPESEAYRLNSVKVIKTGADPEEDVTSIVYKDGKITMPAYAITVSAPMEANNYDVTFHSNTTPAQDDYTQTFTYTVAKNLDANKFTAPTGYQFFKWAESAEGEGKYADKASYTLASAANADLYAKWSAKTIDLVLDGVDDNATDGEGAAEFDGDAIITTNAAWDQHELNGYYTASTGGTLVLSSDGTLSASVEGYTDANAKWIKDADAAVTLYAQWTSLAKYNISYDLTGCTANSGNPTEIALDATSVTLNFDLATNYTWTGALAGVEMGGADLEDSEITFTDGTLIITPTNGFKGNIEVTIVCDYAPATLTLSENGAESSFGSDLKVNDQVTLPNCQVECDKTFVGWSEKNTDITASDILAVGASYTLAATSNKLYAVFATETPGETTDVYTMNITKNTSNSAYATYYDVTFNSIGWKMPGNQTSGNWVKMGGKFSTDSRYIYSKNAISSGVDKVVANHGTKDSEITVNSVTLDVYSTANLAAAGAAGDISSVSGTYVDNGNTTFERPKTADWTGRFYRITYNLSSSASGSNKGIILYSVKMQSVAAPEYSDYSVTCSAKTAAPEFSLIAGEYTEAQTLTITAETGAKIYYNINSDDDPTSESTEYTGAISLNTWGVKTIKAIAIADGKSQSDKVTKVYTMNLPFASLETLAAQDMGSLTSATVTVSFTNTKIKSIATSYQGRVGVYFDIQKEEKDIEIYCADVPETWEAGGKLSKSNLTCTWKRYPATGNLTCWELTPSSWEGFEYSTPDPYTSVADLYAAGLDEGTKVYLNITNAYVHTKTATGDYKFIYIQDGGVGIVLRTSEDFSDENIGKLMTAKIVGTIASSSGRPQIAVTSMSEVSYTTGSRPTAVETTLSASEEADKILSLVKIEGVYAQSKSSNNITVTTDAAGQGTSYNIYDLFNKVQTLPESDKAINVKGLFYKRVDGEVTTYSITPVLASDFEVVSPSQTILPTLDVYGGTSAEPLAVAPGKPIVFTRVEPEVTSNYESYYQIDSNEPVKVTAKTKTIELTGDDEQVIKLKIYSTRPYYTTNEAEYYYKIDNDLTEHAISYPAVQTYVGITGPASAIPDSTVVMTGTQKKNHYYPGVVKVYYVADPDNNPTDTTWLTVTKDEVSQTEATYSFTMPKHAVAVKMGYTKDPTYSVTYQSGGKSPQQGEAPTENAQFAGDSVTVKDNTWTDTKYEFNGWRVVYETGSGEQKEQHDIEVKNGKFMMPTYDVKIIAQWVDIYAVTFDKGTAPATGDAPTVTPKRADAKFNLPANPWTAKGYTFNGWKASSDNETYDAGAEFTMPAQAVTFTAQWEGAEYTKDGQWELVTSNDQLEEGRYYVIACNGQGKTLTATIAGSTNKYLSGVATTFTDESTGDKAIIKKSDLGTGTVIFQLGGETDAWTLKDMETEKYYHTGSNSNPVWLDNARAWETISYNKMQAWESKSSSDTTLQFNKDGGFRPYTSSQKAVQLYRFYRAAFKVTYDANGGTGAPAATKADPTTQIATLSSTVPTLAGNNFLGWTETKGGTGAKYKDGDDFGPMTKDVTLYAQWEKASYNVAVAKTDNAVISAKVQGEETTIAEEGNADVQYQKYITLSYSEVDEDYFFNGWVVTKAGEPSTVVEMYSANVFQVPAYDVNVTAIIASKATTKLTLTLKANGGEGDDIVDDQVTYNTQITVPECTFTNPYATFSHWNTQADGQGTSYNVGQKFTMKTNVDLYAQWTYTSATYTIQSTTSVNVASGGVPEGSSATFLNTYSTKTQLTSGNYMTLTLSGYDGKVITGISLSTKSNNNSGAGTYEVKVGDRIIYTVTGSYKDIFGAWSSTFVARELAISKAYVGTNEDIVIKISATDNSLHCESFTVMYKDGIGRLDLQKDQYSTICLEQGAKKEDIFGISLWTIEEAVWNGDKLSSISIIKNEDDLVAGVPYIIYGEAEANGIIPSGDIATAPVDDNANGLHGSFSKMAFDTVSGYDPENSGTYIISNGILYLCGSNCGIYDHRAYIKASEITDQSSQSAPAAIRRIIGGTDESHTPTDLLNAAAEGDVVRKVIINNQMFILRAGKLYNAAGALVK